MEKTITPHTIQRVFQRFDNMAVGDIEKAFNGGAKVGAFILTLVAIDCLATWYKGADSDVRAYKDFICDFFPNKYAPFAESMYTYLRSGLVHNYSTKKQGYALVDGKSDLHLTRTPEGITILNWENLFRDFLSAKDRYYKKVLDCKKLQYVFQGRIERQGTLDVCAILLANSTTSTVSMIG